MDSERISEGHAPPGPAWIAAERAGHDMSLREESLGLTPTERLRLHDLALARVILLEEAVARKRP